MSGVVSAGELNESAMIVEKALVFIIENYQDYDLSYRKVAKKVNVSPGYFSAIFKSVTGENYQNYIIKLRMEKAKELLKSTNLHAYSISYKVGYSTPQYFCASFKKIVGITPRKYRTL